MSIEGRGGPAGRAGQGRSGVAMCTERLDGGTRRQGRMTTRSGETFLDKRVFTRAESNRRQQRRAHRPVDEQHHVLRHARPRLPADEARKDGCAAEVDATLGATAPTVLSAVVHNVPGGRGAGGATRRGGPKEDIKPRAAAMEQLARN